MNLPPLIKQTEAALAGWPDVALTLGLLVGALVLVAIAVAGPRTLKAVALAWVIAP